MLLASFIFAAVGPVSQYGQLMAGKNSSGKGQIYGSCQGVKDGSEVQVKGMSLYWSLKDEAVEYWNADAVGTMVKNMNIQLIRAAMATEEDWKNGYQGYTKDPNTQKNLVNGVVQGAINNDIYVIIDWHSHCAENQTQAAVGFFTEMAQKWGKYDNVIFEIYNEPKNNCGEQYPDTNAAKSYWSSKIKPYAETVIKAIRQHSDNLVLVGTPYYDQFTNAPITNPLSDNNVAYTFHYYAMTHKTGGEGANALKAMKAGLSVFVSEWGTGTADGGGTPGETQNNSWQSWVNNHKLSWANWSASHISEGTAAFNGGSNRYSISFTNSGNMVKGYLSSNPKTYTACGGTPTPTPVSSSSSVIKSSSSVWVPQSSSSSMPCEWTNTCQTTGIILKEPEITNKEVRFIFDIRGQRINTITVPGTYIKLYTDGTRGMYREF